MPLKKSGSFSRGQFLVILLFVIAVGPGTEGEEIVLDRNSDKFGAWLDITCHYNEDYADFWVYGCPINPSVDINPNYKGFWTPCGAATCEILYSGGQTIPSPTKLTLISYIQGDKSEVQISGKGLMNDTELQSLGTLRQNLNQVGWYEQVLDLSNQTDISILNFTLKSSIGGYVVLDRIVIEWNSNSSAFVSLDTDKDDMKTHWVDQNCHYMDKYEEFWVFGCPVVPLQENTDGSQSGYWSPCSTSTCTMQYFNSMATNFVSVRSYVDGTGGILVTRQRGPGSSTGLLQTEVQLISVGTTGGGWTTVLLPNYPSEDHVLNFELIPGLNGTVLLDNIYVELNGTGIDKGGEDDGTSQANPLVLSSLSIIIAAILFMSFN